MRKPIVATLALLAALLAAQAAEARVTRFVVEQRRVFAEGTSFGTVGQYERLDGRAYMEVDPRDPLNAGMVNIDKAPRNARGLVEFSTPVFILKPIDMSRGNRKIYYGLNNRGNKLESGLRWHNVQQTNDPITAAHAGDGFLMRLGYTVVDAGWQGDVAPGNNRLFPDLPVATEPDGSPIVAPVRVEYSDRTIPAAGTFTLTLEGSAAFTSYETADTDTAHSTLTVRTSLEGAKVSIAADRWAFGRCPTGQASLVPTTTDICLFDGFQADKLYELIYPAKGPKVMALGYAVTRDLVSFLRYVTEDDAGNANPLVVRGPGKGKGPKGTGIRRAYGFGTSSTGMYFRDWLYLGFNEDEAHRRVFDAVQITIPGTHRLFANVEFADPNTYSRQDDRHDFLSTSVAPMTYAVTRDPISGVRDGILKRPKTDPLVFHVDTSLEFWQFRSSLNVHDGLGRPVPPHARVRLYHQTAFQHSSAPPGTPVPGPAGMCAYGSNPNYAGPTHRALLLHLDAWADRGVKPPKSNYPRVQDRTLVTLEQYRAAFPGIPGVEAPMFLNELELLNYGAEFDAEGGRLTLLPPVLGSRYTVLVPRADADGVDVSGIRPIEVRVPLGTNLGWNVRAEGRRAPNLCGLTGSFIPFARTRAERLAAGDPRRSLEERYEDHAGYVRAVRKAARALMHEGFMIEEDAARLVREAEASEVLR